MYNSENNLIAIKSEGLFFIVFYRSNKIIIRLIRSYVTSFIINMSSVYFSHTKFC